MLATISMLALICSPAPVLAPPSMTMSNISAENDPFIDEDVVVEQGYGAQILAADGAGIAMMLLGASLESEGLAWAGLGTMAFGPGVVHASHNRGGAAVTSMVMRPTVVFAGMYAGAAMEDCSGDRELDFCGLGGAILGGLVAYGAVAVFDAAYLARTKKTPRSLSLTPSVAASSQGVRVGIGGSF